MAWRRLTGMIERRTSPQVQRAWYRWLAARFVRRLRAAGTLDEKIAVATNRAPIRSNQRTSEIRALLEEVARLRPRTICEIGCDRGGTLALFADLAPENGLLISIDPAHVLPRSDAFAQFARADQTLVRLPMDSHATETRSRVESLLNGRSLDFLFIDGDHSYSGVLQDYLMYAPLVREGGLVAFHDIVPDASHQPGDAASDTYVGGVPRFFRQCMERHHAAVRFVENEQQDGFGIGLVRWPAADRAARIVASIAQASAQAEERAA